MDILIVDDEPLARARLQRLLAEEPDYRVVAEAGDAGQALAAVLQQDPDIVLLDIHMRQRFAGRPPAGGTGRPAGSCAPPLISTRWKPSTSMRWTTC